MSAQKPRCLLIGDHALLLDGLCYLFRDLFEVVTVAGKVDQALRAAADFRPDIAIIDLEPGHGALEMGRRLREAHSGLAVTFLTNEDAPAWGVNAVSKRGPASKLLDAIENAAARSELPSSTVGQKSRARLQGDPKLSERERQVLTLLLRGHSMKYAARALGITPRTVAFHKYHVMQANGLRNNSELLDFAIRNGIVPAVDQPH